MSKFRIGQRLKYVGGDGRRATGVVSGFHSARDFDFVIRVDVETKCDAGVTHSAGTEMNACDQDWVPIQDRPELGSWDVIRALGLDIGEAMPA